MIDLLLALFAFRFFPMVHAFAPYLAKSFFKTTFEEALALGLFCGFILDLFTSGTSMGFHSLNLLLTSAIVYKLKWLFSPHKAHGLILFTICFSLISTLIYILQSRVPINLAIDLIFLPLFDGAFGFLWFSCPFIAYNFFKKHYLRIKHG
ncbi:MAG: hypothetical protein SP1CHLAM54_08840 [Chlamydiia bacterium]|nr:hypothetical protein [Chlamydiia bacterium]MCH9615790.1 hypothetical protein [Chlamydiia bacterium]MCH9628807.1 hypothetical protein [Chlamydiia bacterium]